MSWPIIGHQHVVARLARSIATGRVAHAYLFSGPPHVGKTTLALTLAQALQCSGPQPPCGACTACGKVARGTHPDVHLIDGEREALKIDQVRDLQRELSMTPFEGQRRVAILVGMEQATVEAANCLLKTLEEPAPSAVLLLTTADAELLLPTIVSRCQVINLNPLPVAVVEEALRTRWHVPDEHARLLARLSRGRIGWAIRAVEDETVLQRRRETLDELIALVDGGRVERLAYAETLSRQPERWPEWFELWLGWWRDMLLVKEGVTDALTNLDQEAQLRRYAARYDRAQISATIRRIQQAARWLEQNVNARLALEALLLSLPQPT